MHSAALNSETRALLAFLLGNDKAVLSITGKRRWCSMKVFWAADSVGEEMAGGAIAIGNFDGMHLGHRALVERVKELEGKTGVLSFTPHPSELLHKGTSHFYLTNDQQKIQLFLGWGLDVAIIHRINERFLHISPEHFVKEILVKALKIKHVVVGDDFSFGHKASGNVNLLISLGSSMGFSTHVVKQISFAGHRVSSTNIRTSLQEGNLALANSMLGRYYSLRAQVHSGQKKGGLLGFRTANLHPSQGFALRRGVYATVTRIIDESRDYVSVTNVGYRPTVTDEHVLTVETHCLDQELDLYGKDIEVFFIERLRDEAKFPSIMALQAQVQKDCQAVRQSYLLDPSRFLVAN